MPTGHAFGIWRYIFGKFYFEESFDSLINFLICVNITMFVQFKFSKNMVLISQRQSYVFSLLTRPESIVSHIGFHRRMESLHLHDETLCYTGKENLI